MSWTDCKIFCIYPQDETTSFLNRIVSHLTNSLGNDFHCHKVKLTESSHSECLKRTASLKQRLILFLGHGRSDMLYGSCGKSGENIFLSDDVETDNTDFFNKKDFISLKNADVFEDKIVISFSCNSNTTRRSIGNASISGGALSFVGFGDIQTDFDKEKEMTEREIAIFKGIIVKIIKKTILYSYANNLTVENLVDAIKIMTNKEIHILLTKHKGIKYRNRIAKHLFNFKNEIKIFGDKHLNLNHC